LARVKLLLIEDERPIRAFLRASLKEDEFEIKEAETAADGMSLVGTWSPDVVLLDLGLPDKDGLVVTQLLREWTQVPIIVLSARGREQDKIAALDAGADDYLTKPFSLGELMARIRVSIRHRQSASTPDEPTFETGNLKIDFAARRVWKGAEEVHLTPTEYKLLSVLAKNAGRVLTRRQLLQEVWGPGYTTETHYLSVYSAQLRHKIEVDPARPKIITTEAGIGYRLRMD